MSAARATHTARAHARRPRAHPREGTALTAYTTKKRYLSKMSKVNLSGRCVPLATYPAHKKRDFVKSTLQNTENLHFS